MTTRLLWRALGRGGRRRFRRRHGAWAAALLLAAIWFSYVRPHLDVRRPPPEAPGQFFVNRVVDGDTLVLADGTRVRLLGVDAPELGKGKEAAEPWADEAAQFTRSRLERAWVRLEFDRERRDRYGRTLAYVYRDDVLHNEELILYGFSAAQLQYPYSAEMKRRFRDAEIRAREERRGIWSAVDRSELRDVEK